MLIGLPSASRGVRFLLNFLPPGYSLAQEIRELGVRYGRLPPLVGLLNFPALPRPPGAMFVVGFDCWLCKNAKVMDAKSQQMRSAEFDKLFKRTLQANVLCKSLMTSEGYKTTVESHGGAPPVSRRHVEPSPRLPHRA